MKRLFLVVAIFAICCLSKAYSQNIEISGDIIENDTGEEVPFATVMLLNESDSTLLEYAISDTYGHFAFRNVKNRDYLLKISHISYTPYQKKIKKTEGKTINVGTIKLSPIAEVLMEVVIHEAQAPLLFKGDTIEYNAATFKVAPGSTVEDLLKKLPGIEVDADGGITSMGKDVNKVLVDGKNFFGDDPKMVTQNLDAEAVSKVQVYTQQSEQEKLTGIKDGSQDKVMNLELKQEYKKGYFGKASVGAGWGDGNFIPWLAKASFNRFNDKYQLSFIGYGNDINSTRTDWEDMREFKGSSMFTYDNGDFGFNSIYSYHGSFPIMGWDGNGFAQNYGGGINFNYDDGKTIFYTNYTYSQLKSQSDIFSNTKTMLTDTSYMQVDTSNNK
ncbi:MAG: TonB-dependent receptor, partial [Bacteroidales bacterium]|nr:TonB-dependent receptor [Bacteroidales bacterium]